MISKYAIVEKGIVTGFCLYMTGKTGGEPWGGAIMVYTGGQLVPLGAKYDSKTGEFMLDNLMLKDG